MLIAVKLWVKPPELIAREEVASEEDSQLRTVMLPRLVQRISMPTCAREIHREPKF